MVLENNPSGHGTWSIRCHVGIHGDFTSILHSLTALVPQASCEANLEPVPPFPPMRVLEAQWSRGPSVSCVKRLKSSGAKIPTSKSFDPLTAVPSADGHVSPWSGSLSTYLLSFPPPHLSLVTSQPVPTSTRPTYLSTYQWPTDRPTSLLAKGPLARFLVGLANPRFSSASFLLLRFVVASLLVASIATLPRQRT